MPPRAREPKPVPPGGRLVLHRFVRREFGHHEGTSGTLDRPRGIPAETTPGNESEYARALCLRPERAIVARERMAEYDADIAARA